MRTLSKSRPCKPFLGNIRVPYSRYAALARLRNDALELHTHRALFHWFWVCWALEHGANRLRGLVSYCIQLNSCFSQASDNKKLVFGHFIAYEVAYSSGHAAIFLQTMTNSFLCIFYNTTMSKIAVPDSNGTSRDCKCPFLHWTQYI